MTTVTAIYDADKNELAVTFRKETRVFPARDWLLKSNGRVTAHKVFACKFRTGAKLWPACVNFYPASGNAVVEVAGFTNKGGAQQIVGWFDADNPRNTQSRGARR